MKYYDLENNIFNHWASKINEITNRNMRLSYKALSVMVNTHMPYHADNTAPEEGSYILGIPSHNIRFGLNIVDHISWKPNHCPNRVLTAIVYINTILKDNNDYGATALPQHNLLIHPVSKRLSIFSCDHYSIHGVMNVGKNIRIAALLWFEENT